ncbi:MAG: hypothetical protein ACFFER_10860, partial [Candidatus Thorarchaeota archaeon]
RFEASRIDSIERAASLPFFGHAVGRQDQLRELAEMSSAGKDAGYISPEERAMIWAFHKKGMSSGEIRKEIWNRMGIARTKVAIWRVTKDTE